MINRNKNILSIPIALILISMLFISSCNPKPNIKAPDNLIQKEKFIDIMVDIRMIETTIRNKIGRGNDINKTTEYYYNYVFDKYNISREQFNSSLDYYSKDVKEMQEINISVVEKLTQLESEVKAQKKAE
jgi:hypothetical protein